MIKYILRITYIIAINLYCLRKNKSRVSLLACINTRTRLSGYNRIHKHSVLSNSKIGFASYIGANTNLPHAIIGKYCSIANNVSVLNYTHPTEKFVSTHPAFFSLQKQSGFTYVEKQIFNERLGVSNQKHYVSILIGNDVWIGSNVLIMGGVTIGDGSIIAAGSIVTKDVPEYTIIGGVPAKKIKLRFSNEEIQYLSNLKWWDKKPEWIKENIKYLHDINIAMKRI